MSIPTHVLLSKLRTAGYTFFSGVPCSIFGDLFGLVAESSGLLTVPAANEGSAVALVAGAALSGQRGVVALQNSGLGNVINPLTSLLMVNKIPILLLLSVRGHPDEPADEPQHTIMGANTKALLNQLSIECCDFDGTESGLDRALAQGDDTFHRSAPFALLFRRGQLSECSPDERQVNTVHYGVSVGQAIELIYQQLEPDTLVVSTTGYISRELLRVQDRPTNFYMQGSLGHCSAVAAGVALTSPTRTVLALDGDGGALMHMGILSTIGYAAPQNLIHVVLDNEGYVSTGGQFSTSRTTSLEAVASACGYRTATRCERAEHITTALRQCAWRSGPHFVVCKVNRLHPSQLARVTSRYSPLQNKTMFQRGIGICGNEIATTDKMGLVS
ncbi:phosphonopyruvate decarboxylase [Bradyrhizobium iriomotense]|uniref:phosphonopyruvate decarboxylase n=1 Tax=Bradyrhizobium iriomotense TaxID=441950 RepID=UPI0024E123E8|nr:phosphonopyruvate decarboxylase [Bradyrhizobium iriomotense]